ncbi:glycosyltransferase family 4 protein [Candidatus Woesearchaeota archaeon]|nr:glycosyltransferase family 4 protein [Candidatus Woesearchaeota archaeon]
MLKTLMIGLTPPLEGGSERHIFEVSSRLKNVTVLTQRWSLCEDKIEINLIKTKISYLKSLFFFISIFLKIPRIFLSKFKVVHIHENYLFLFLPIFKIKFKTVATIHGIKGFKFYDNKFLWFIFKNFLKFSDKIIVVSLADREILKKEFNNMTYIPNGVDTKIYKEIKVRVSNKITFVGRIHEQKGIIYLLKAFYEIKDKIPNFRLEIIGNINDYAKELMNEFSDSKILWRGFILDRKELFQELVSSYILVYPSLWEALPWPALLEGLASGRPVISSNLNGMRNIFSDKEDLLLFEPGSYNELGKKLLKLVNDENFANFIGMNGKNKAKEYDWDIIAKKVSVVLEKW